MHPQSIKGKKNLNILVLAVVYNGMAIPVYWLLLKAKAIPAQVNGLR